MKESFRENPSEPIYIDPLLDVTHIFEKVIRIGDYASLFCKIENERAGYAAPCWCLLSGRTNKTIEDKEKLQKNLTQTLHALILEAIPTYMDDDVVFMKERVRDEMKASIERVRSDKAAKEHWHKFVPAEMKAEMSMEQWLKDRQESKKRIINQNKVIILASKDREANLQQEILKEKFIVIVAADNLVEYHLRLQGPGDPLYHSFIYFLKKHQIKGTGFMPGGWFDSHRPGTPNNFTPSERSEDVYEFFLQQSEIYLNAKKQWRSTRRTKS